MPHRHALYGGAGGGGKSDALLMGALQYVHVPGYHAIILRRSIAALKKASSVMNRARSWLRPWLGKGVHWNAADHIFTFDTGPGNEPATLEFGYLRRNDDLGNYDSAEYQFIGFEEATQFTEYLYRNMSARLRRLKEFTVPLRIRGASNPGGPGHGFFKLWFVKGGWPFVPAKLDDNPYIDTAEYTATLQDLPPLRRKQILEGDWDAVQAGVWFDRTKAKIIRAAPAGIKWIRYWDLAATEATGDNDPDGTWGIRLGLAPDDRIIIKHAAYCWLNPGPRDQFILRHAKFDGRLIRQVFEQEGGSGGKAQVDTLRTKVLKGFPTDKVKATGSKEDNAGPIQSQWDAENVCLVEGPWNIPYLDQMEAFPTPEVHDDAVDGTSGGYNYLTSPTPGVSVGVATQGKPDEDDW